MKSALDNISKRLLEVIQLNGRISNQDLASRIGISPSPCLQRRKRLEDLDIITGYETRIALSKVTRHIEVIAEVTLKTNTISAERDFEAYISNVPEIVTCHAVAGKVDYFANIFALDIRHYQQIIDRMIGDLGIIETVTSHVIHNRTKEFSGLPLELLLED